MLYSAINPRGHAMNPKLITGRLVSALRLVFPSKKSRQQLSTGERHQHQSTFTWEMPLYW
jgi:hypothetical protein